VCSEPIPDHNSVLYPGRLGMARDYYIIIILNEKNVAGTYTGFIISAAGRHVMIILLFLSI